MRAGDSTGDSSWGHDSRGAARSYRQVAWRWWHRIRWPVAGAFWLAALVLGYTGFARNAADLGQATSPSTLFYLTLQLFVIESGAVSQALNWELEVARLLAPLVAAYTALQALAALFSEQLRSVRVRLGRDHVVICGLGRKGFLLAQEFLDRGITVVVIERDEGNELIRLCRERGAFVLVGDATAVEVLCKAGVTRAKYLVAVCGGDGANAEIAVRARRLTRCRRRGSLTCFVHLVDPQICRLVRDQEIGREEACPFRLEFFDIFERGARALLHDYPYVSDGQDPIDLPAHLVVIGAGRMGQALIAQAAMNWWMERGEAGPRLRITVVDRQAQPKVELLRLRYPLLERACELTPWQMEVESPEFQRAEFLLAPEDGCQVAAVYVGLGSDSLGLLAGLALLEQLRSHRVPIVVCMESDSGLATLLQGPPDGSGQLRAFTLLNRVCNLELLLGGTHALLARAIHEKYVHDQAGRGQTAQANPSMVPWDELPESLKESNERAADHIGVKLRAVGYRLGPLGDWGAERFRFTAEEVELMARMEHDRFVEERRSQGWKSGPRDAKRKTSPYLVPWEELPEDVRELDRDQVRGLPAFLARAGFQLYPSIAQSEILTRR